MKAKNGLLYLWVRWRTFVVITVPLALIPLAMMEGKAAKCGYVLGIMAVFWMTEALPLPITSLIPIVALPMFGILSTNEVCMLYFKETNVMFMGGLIIAIAVEHCNLHRRIALRVLRCVGTSPRRLLFGFMLTTMFLSMWISNSAACAMMSPIVSAILSELSAIEKITEAPAEGGEKGDKPRESLPPKPPEELEERPPEENPPPPEENPPTEEGAPADQEQARKASERGSRAREPSVQAARTSVSGEPDVERGGMRPTSEQICYFLSIAYAANIGGTGTITGTAPNLVFKGLVESIFTEAEGVNFASWMEFNVPFMLLNTTLAWFWLQLLYMSKCRRKKAAMKLTKAQKIQIYQLIRQKHKEMGSITFHELSVLFLFILDVALWFFRKPEFVPGWQSLFPEKPVKDAAAAMLVVILLFVLPANRNFLNCDPSKPMRCPPLLTWKVLEQKLPFGIILLLGSGYAISKACQVSGLSDLMGQSMQGAGQFPRILTLGIVLFATTFATEFASNTAIANIMLPVVARMATVIRVHPVYLMMPTTVCCSFAFMLPVATPPNAIVVAASNMRSFEMIKTGFGMNIICVLALLVCFHYVGVPMYHLENFPKWAEVNHTNTS